MLSYLYSKVQRSVSNSIELINLDFFVTFRKERVYDFCFQFFALVVVVCHKRVERCVTDAVRFVRVSSPLNSINQFLKINF